MAKQVNKVNFKGVEFDSLLAQAGFNSFILYSQKWFEKSNNLLDKLNKNKIYN